MKERKKLSIIGFVFMVTMMFIVQPIKNVHAEDKEITVGEFIKLVINEINRVDNQGLVVETQDYTMEEDYVIAAKKVGLIKETDRFIYKNAMTVEECAVISNRADIYMHGETVDQGLINRIEEKERITDIDSIKKRFRKDIIEAFAKGIIVGEPNGMYSQDRVLHSSNKVQLKDIKDIINRITYEINRSKISFDGQVIRLTNLPKNAKDFDYILESFPNDFYEMSYRYEVSTSNKRFKEFQDYCVPNRVNLMLEKQKLDNSKVDKKLIINNIDNWVERIEQNLYERFNVNYLKIDESWIDTMAETYSTCFSEKEEKKLGNALRSYVKEAKNNCVIIKTDKISVEPSTLYYSMGSYYIRCYVKFMVTSCKDMNKTFLYCTDDRVYFKDLKKQEWHEGYYDIAIGSSDPRCLSMEYGIYNECISDYLMIIKDHLLDISYNRSKKMFYQDGFYFWK